MTLHDKMAQELTPLGGVLRCKECGHEIPIKHVNLSQSLQTGWPECHGKTMTWVTERLLKMEREEKKS